jgi:hypothetical protein
MGSLPGATTLGLANCSPLGVVGMLLGVLVSVLDTAGAQVEVDAISWGTGLALLVPLGPASGAPSVWDTDAPASAATAAAAAAGALGREVPGVRASVWRTIS